MKPERQLKHFSDFVGKTVAKTFNGFEVTYITFTDETFALICAMYGYSDRVQPVVLDSDPWDQGYELVTAGLVTATEFADWQKTREAEQQRREYERLKFIFEPKQPE